MKGGFTKFLQDTNLHCLVLFQWVISCAVQSWVQWDPTPFTKPSSVTDPPPPLKHTLFSCACFISFRQREIQENMFFSFSIKALCSSSCYT